jgi:hypothetical protein
MIKCGKPSAASNRDVALWVASIEHALGLHPESDSAKGRDAAEGPAIGLRRKAVANMPSYRLVQGGTKSLSLTRGRRGMAWSRIIWDPTAGGNDEHVEEHGWETADD